MVQRIKYFWLRYYELDKAKDKYVLNDHKVDAKELVEFIINNAYNSDILIEEAQEI